MATNIPTTIFVKKHIDWLRGGSLSAIEPMNLLPADFPGLKRFYFITSVPPIVQARGGHYHCIKHELMFPVQGRVEIILKNGGSTHIVILENKLGEPTIPVLYVPPGWWHEVSFSENAILGVLASTTYKEDMEAQDDHTEVP